jgi:hypothetical protein
VPENAILQVRLQLCSYTKSPQIGIYYYWIPIKQSALQQSFHTSKQGLYYSEIYWHKANTCQFWINMIVTLPLSPTGYKKRTRRFFLSLNFPISLSDFTIEILSKNLIMKYTMRRNLPKTFSVLKF